MAKAEIQLSAEDLTKAAFDSAKRNLQGLHSQAQSLPAVFGSIGLAITGAFAAGSLIGVINAADHLNDLSKSTGIAVDQLAGLQLAAKQSGGDLDGIAASINKLSVAIGKDPDKFAKLGVTAKDPLEAFKQLADVFAAIQDPQLRAALGAEALGKSWASAAPLLAEGGSKIGEMVEKGRKLSGMNQEAADRADEFNDRLVELKTAADGAKFTLATEMLPALAEVTKAVIEAYTESGKLKAIWVALGAVGAFAFTDEFSTAKSKLNGVNDELTKLQKKQAELKNSGPIVRSIFGGDKIDAEIEGLKVKAAELQTVIDKPAVDAAKKKADAAARDADKAAAAAAAEKAREFLAAQESAKLAADKAAKSRETFIKTLLKEAETLTMGNAVAKEREAILLGITGNQLAYVRAILAEIDAYKLAVKTAQDRVDLRAKESDTILGLMVANTESANAAVKSSRDALQAAVEEYEQMGLSKSQIAELTVRQLELNQARKFVAGSDGYEALQKQIEAQKELVDVLQKTEIRVKEIAAADESRKVTERLSEGISEGILDGFRKGGSITDIFVRELKAQFAKTVLQPIISPIVAEGNAALGGIVKGLGSPFGGGLGATALPTTGDFARLDRLSFDGGGYTGDGLRTGGLDGKGGFMAMMHPQETVIDHSKGQAAGSVVLNNTVHVAGGMGSAEVYKTVQLALSENNRAMVDMMKRNGLLA